MVNGGLRRGMNSRMSVEAKGQAKTRNVESLALAGNPQFLEVEILDKSAWDKTVELSIRHIWMDSRGRDLFGRQRGMTGALQTWKRFVSRRVNASVRGKIVSFRDVYREFGCGRPRGLACRQKT